MVGGGARRKIYSLYWRGTLFVLVGEITAVGI